MFSPKIIAAKLEKLRARTKLPLVEHTLAESNAVSAHFSSLTQSDGKRQWMQRPNETEEEFAYVQWEKEWIQNELYVCAVSFPYWFFRYFFIKTKEGEIRRPDILEAQMVYLDLLSELDEQQLPILLLVLKGRQLGISTVTEAIILWIAMYRRGAHTVIASAEEDKSITMSEMIWTGLDNLPTWMKPIFTGESRKQGPKFGENETDIQVQHGAQTKGISRGSTPIACHLSEVAYYTNPIETIESSLLKAMHENKKTFLVLESTPRKKGDWLHRTWLKNRRGEATGHNRFTCLFLPWYVGRDKYPTADWIRNHPIPENWRPQTRTDEQAAKAALYVATQPLLAKHMGDDWTMPIEQKWFWEWSIIDAEESNDEESVRSFYSELAADEVSCFAAKKWSVYEPDVLARAKAAMNPNYIDYAFTGNGIDKRFQLRDFQSLSARRVKIDWLTIESEHRHWELVPLHRTPDDPNLDFFLRVWEPPLRGWNYTIGIDIGGGLGRDNSSIDVLRVGKPGEPSLQVAQLYSPWVPSAELPPMCNALGIWYGTFMEPTPEALMVPETQVAVGDPISYQLNKEGYTNFHRMHRYDTANAKATQGSRLGWATSGWSRQLMLDQEKLAIDNGWLVINSERTYEELEGQERDDDRSDHSSTTHDDSIFSLGMAYFVSHDQETLSSRIGQRPTRTLEVQAEEKKTLDSVELIMAREILAEERRELDPDEDEMSYIY